MVGIGPDHDEAAIGERRDVRIGLLGLVDRLDPVDLDRGAARRAVGADPVGENAVIARPDDDDAAIGQRGDVASLEQVAAAAAFLDDRQ
ncbi:MAG: hypothetical protein JNM13_13725 [Hyphomicrobiaceae bacterium]|nr:hypothetical protein [Hyphomicrobiaceae bacterium]